MEFAEKILALLEILQEKEKHTSFLTRDLTSLKSVIDDCLKKENNDFLEIKDWFKQNKKVRDYLYTFAQGNRAKFEIKKHQLSDDAEIRQNLTELSKRISESKQEDSNKPDKTN